MEDGIFPQPFYTVERPPCPFYGFNGKYGILMDTGGNQCGLLTLSNTPCQMEREGDTPNLSRCTLFNTEEHKAALGKILNVKIFPNELRRPGTKPWGGITLKKWFEYLKVPIED